ncbi:bifunctional DNA primase/polymerase [Trebonia sp.]|uniref:bifunctional DNA primase/polymerase n=1 Tax=Trebonia sp. TaxID=2767075 RepID=UPI00261961AE|nr:bifunctional DNA primase/polymerase [Trebonia sp.]
MTAALRQALAYAAAGWPVFPCKAGLKVPDTNHGFKDATTDPATIRQWWPAGSDRNVAIATGAPGPDVLDVDVKPDGSGWAAFNRLKAAGLLTGARALIRTPSGGLHAYYAGSSQPSGRLVRHFLDFKAAGGYVVAPPSVVGGRPYEVLDNRAADGRVDWQAVRRLLDPPQPPARPGSGAGSGALVAWVATLHEGNRNAGLFWAACRMAENDSPNGDLEQLVAAAVQVGLPEDEARRTVASAARKAAAR